MIRIEDLDFSYADGPFRLRVGRLAIDEGAAVALVGPSGCGKTTLLHLIAGILSGRRGRIVVGGHDVSSMREAARRDFRVRNVGLVFQEFELIEYLDVLDNVLLPYHVNRSLRLGPEVRARARALLDEVGLGDKLARNVRRLSQGERQRVAVCRAVLARPRVILADEPTGELDPSNKERILALLLRSARDLGATLLVVTHDHTLLERFDRVVDAKEVAA